MKTVIWMGLALFLVQTVLSAPTNSTKISSPPATKSDSSSSDNENLCKSSDSEVDCDQTEYTEYMACVEEKKTIRKRRQAACPYAKINDVMDYNCLFEYNKCVAGCQNDTICEKGCPVCDGSGTMNNQNGIPANNCTSDFNSCVSNCQSGQPCQTECQNLCPNARPLGYKTVIFEGHGGAGSERVQVPIGIGHNITTIIKLNNYINNTHTINIPTNVNSTNINTIHVYTNKTEGGRFGLGETPEGSCCFAVHPKTCRSSTNGLRCHHKRHKTCGDQCKSRIIHVQSRSRCQKRGGCQSGVAYVPEPNPRCHSIRQWPYTTCGQQSSQRNCNGCYDHYGYGYDSYQNSIPERCNACYDDGYDNGPMYRRGPVLRPSYYHQPPCYVTGTCQNYYEDCGYGCFGHQAMNPVYGYYPPPPPQPPQPQYYYPYYPQQGPQRPPQPPPQMWPEENDLDFFPEDFSGESPVDEQGLGPNDWDLVVQKCKVINADNDTVIIRNCTNSDLDKNPYAAQPVSDDNNADLEPEENPFDQPFYPQEPYYPPQQPYYPQQYYQGPVNSPYAFRQPYQPYYQPPPQQQYPGPRRLRQRPPPPVDRPSYYNAYGGEYETPEDFLNDGNPEEFWNDMDENELEKHGFVRDNEIESN